MKQEESSSDNIKQTRIRFTESGWWMSREREGIDSRRERERGGILEGISDPHHTPALSITFITAAISGEVFGTGE